MKRYTVTITPLTTLHIGTGNEFGPLEYTIIRFEDGGEPEYWRFSTDNIIASLNKQLKDKIMKLIERNDLESIASLLDENIQENQILYSSPTTLSLEEKFGNNRFTPQNQLLVAEMIRTPNSFKPLIPGSSLKGSIRTAFVSEFAKKYPHRADKAFNRSEKINKDGTVYGYDGAKFERALLEYHDAKEDPFRAVAISDCVIEGDNNQLVAEVFNFNPNKAKKSDAGGFVEIQMIKEQILGALPGGNAQGVCELNIQTKLLGIRNGVKDWSPIKEKITIEKIIKACNDFYKDKLKQEHDKFYKNAPYQELTDTAKELLKVAEEISEKNQECLIRVGRFSQVECVSIDEYRKPKARNNIYGKTRNLADKLYPLGWCKLKFEEIK